MIIKYVKIPMVIEAIKYEKKSKDIALDFRDFTGSSKPCVVEFNVPKGIKGIDLKDFDIVDMEQKEVLLARNQKFIIKEVRQEQDQFYFKADLVAEKGYNHIEYLHKKLDFIGKYTNEKSFIPKGSEFKNTKVIAQDKEIRELSGLVKNFGQGFWEKKVGKIESKKYIMKS